jgi:hypothetical protein
MANGRSAWNYLWPTRSGQPRRQPGRSGETEAHWEGLPMVAWPGQRSTAAVAGPEGWWRRRRRCRGAGHWCRACGGEAMGRRWSEMAPSVKALVKEEPAARRTVVPEAPRDGWVGWGRQCGMVGWCQGASSSVLLPPRWHSGGGIEGPRQR